ncbi:nucleolar complex protein 2 [Dorcoceras hygrometricum]|uniref:Nucleolar complex protein 2 n=1 Tax=Dorcoceras hygrometricum TaxID=472368 RepID=A0A2Z7DEA1_9LAMI|nr:nucleolar complex protein 2 [Dorcoceras hygrometricum]
MGKLGKKARKFAKKNLQSVLKQRRKTKALFKKKSSKGAHNDEKEKLISQMESSNERLAESRVAEYISLDAMFADNDNNDVTDESDSDGYLFEVSGLPLQCQFYMTMPICYRRTLVTYLARNQNLFADLAILKKKLGRLKKKDPEFSKFLKIYSNSHEAFPNVDLYSDEDRNDQEELSEGGLATGKGKLLTTSIVNTWFQMIREEGNQSAFTSLLNAYRTACHYGAESIGHRIDDSETFCNILVFTLSNADDTFRLLLQLSSSDCTKETISELKKASKWESVKPLIKSYMRSTLFLLDQVTDRDILAFALTRFRSSLIFFVAFPSLVKRLMKVTVQLWATSGGLLSTASLLILRDAAAMFSSSYFTTCLSKTMIAFISRSRVAEITDIKHMQFLRDSIVDLCSLDVQKSSVKLSASISQLAKLIQFGLQTKTKEAVKRICSWECVNCIDLWVRFISTNMHDYDLQSSLFMTIQLIYALALMFPGPRYFPLRLKCIEWLNCLSSSSGNFIPLALLVLDILEYKVVKENRKAQMNFNIASVLKLPKHYLKSKHFQEESVRSAIEQLSLHFAQWSTHISFPDLACIPLLCMRKFTETTTSESLRRLVKHLIDQVEQNVNFVQKKRDEVSFSPNDHQSVDSFLQLEKSSLNNSFTNYYKSLQEKVAERRKRGQ